jgi:hypothetical protein
MSVKISCLSFCVLPQLWKKYDPYSVEDCTYLERGEEIKILPESYSPHISR